MDLQKELLIPNYLQFKSMNTQWIALNADKEKEKIKTIKKKTIKKRKEKK